MKVIKDHINKQQFLPFYLLYGEDSYMRRLYKDKLKNAMLQGSDSMNLGYFSGERPDISKIMDLARTMPFFFDKRVIVIENSNLFKDANDLSDYLKESMDTTFFIFNETNVDKRSRLYKYVKDKGYAVEMNGLTEYELTAFIKSEMAKGGVAITDDAAGYLLHKVGGEMNTLVNECFKLSSFVMDKQVATREDIDIICTTLLENRIFEMLDAVAMGQMEKGVKLYQDLIILRESPAKILRLITRHFHILYRMQEGKKSGADDKSLCAALKIPPFALRKYMGQLAGFTREDLLLAINLCLDTEEAFKTGRLDEQIGVEMLILQFSNRKK